MDKNIGSATIKKLFEKKIDIPHYQRPYSWEKEQVEDLIEDLIEAFHNKKDKYLIGNIIFHEKENHKLNIVDGQQRTITLALILSVLNECSFTECKLNLNSDQKQSENNTYCTFLNEAEISQLSAKRLKENHQIIKNRLKQNNELYNFILENVIVTYIKTTSQDESFILFDSQNTRGKPLARKDLLKVHHLHHMEKEKLQIDIREKYAKKWEEIEKQKGEDSLEYMLEFLIGLPRLAIRGELQKEHIKQIDVFKELKTKSSKTQLNKYNQPALFKNFYFDFEKREVSYEFVDEITITFGNKFFTDNLLSMPFEISLSVIGGERFFWFVLKYSELLDKIKDKNFYKKLDSVDGTGNLYLKKIYKSALFFYSDKFGDYKFDEFAMSLSKLFIILRASYDSINPATVINFMWDKENKFDIFKSIYLNSASEDIIDQIEQYLMYADKNKIESFNEKNKNDIRSYDTKKQFIDCFNKQITKSLIGEKK